MTREEEKDLDSLKLREVLDVSELNLTDSRLEQLKEVWLCSYQNLVNDLKGFSHEQNASGFFELGWRAADENPPKGTSLIKWQTGEPKENGRYLIQTNNDGIQIAIWSSFVKTWSLYNDSEIVAWCKLSDIKPYKEETMEGKLISKEEKSLKIDTSLMEKRQIVFSADAPDETELVLGDNFEIKVEDKKTYVVRKKPQYPKTYEECCKVLNITALDLEILDVRNDRAETIYSKNLDRLLNSFRKLIICRDAYWKIAGDWKHDCNNPNKETFYFLFNSGEHIENGRAQYPINKVLIFPTEEMRDAFYENFKDLINETKELL